MKKILLALALLSSQAFAGPNDFIFMQRNALDTGNIQRVIASPATTGFFTYNATTKLGGYTTFGSGLTWTNGVLSATMVPGPAGADGAQGPKGDKGDKGDTGNTGAPGTTDWAGITNKPTTLSGFGITDAASQASLANYATTASLSSYATTASLSGYATTSALNSGLAGKFNAPSGTTSQYVRGDGSLATLDAYPAASNPAGYLNSISGAQVMTALGITPISQAGARSAISLTTTGSGAATYNSTTGVLNVPTPASVTVPVINRTRATTAADGSYVWTLATACAAGAIPVISITPESSTAGDPISHRIVSATNTTVTVFAGRSPGLTVLGLTVLGIPTGAAIPVHLIAVCP